jgi:hypothetical protein
MRAVRLLLLGLALLPLSALEAGAGGNKLPPAAQAILDRADQIELYSLEPNPTAEQRKASKEKPLHGWLVLGKTKLEAAPTRKAVLDALAKGMAAPSRGAKCFDPRHAIRATRGGKTVDLVICFECSWVHVHLGGKKDGPALTIASGTQPAFDKVLKAAGVPLARKR